MPDVRGLTEADARQVIADAGYNADIITVNTTPSLLPPGTVAAQSPVQGVSRPSAIVLSLPAPAVMPKLAGQTVEIAADTLARMGAEAKIVRVYDQAALPGVVLRTTPEEGKALTATPEIIVAAIPSTAPLTTLDTKGNCSSATSGSVNGLRVTTGVSCTARGTDTSTYWILQRQMGRVQGVVGIEDNSDPRSKAQVTITADGKVLLAKDFAYGQSEKVDFDTANVLRLEITVKDLSAPDLGLSSPRIVWAEATLVGSSEAILALEGTP